MDWYWYEEDEREVHEVAHILPQPWFQVMTVSVGQSFSCYKARFSPEKCRGEHNFAVIIHLHLILVVLLVHICLCATVFSFYCNYLFMCHGWGGMLFLSLWESVNILMHTVYADLSKCSNNELESACIKHYPTYIELNVSLSPCKILKRHFDNSIWAEMFMSSFVFQFDSHNLYHE